MVITYYGKQFFKVEFGRLTVAFNPVSRVSKTGIISKFGADIALITTHHPDYNGLDQVSHGERTPFALTGPGDYEVKEIFIKGVVSNALIDKKKYINTIYTLAIDNINIAFLGALFDPEISKEAREAIGNPDILFIPVGSGAVLDAKSASRLAHSLEPRLIIPMDYDNASLKVFLKEMGEEKAEKTDKLTLKQKDLDGKEGEVIVLEAI